MDPIRAKFSECLKARGVFDTARRQQLVSVAQQLVQSTGEGPTMGIVGEGEAGGVLPGVPTTWDMHSSTPEVRVTGVCPRQRRLAHGQGAGVNEQGTGAACLFAHAEFGEPPVAAHNLP